MPRIRPRGFLPATGTLHHLKFPDAAPDASALRIETGVRAGDAISPFYDPMIAKLVVHGADGRRRWRRSATALGADRDRGLDTSTLAFLVGLAADADFAAGDVDTGLIARHQDTLTASPAPDQRIVAQAVMVAARSAVAAFGRRRRSLVDASGLCAFPQARAASDAVSTARTRSPLRPPSGRTVAWMCFCQAKAALTLDPGQPARAALWPGHVTVFRDAQSHTFAIPDPFERSEEAASKADTLRAPMPGLVKIVRGRGKGDAVIKGQPLLVLEAMKMEHTIAAPHDGCLPKSSARARR